MLKKNKMSKNQPFSANCLCSDDSNPSKIGLYRNVYDPGLCCIKPSEDKRTLNSCSGTILNLKMSFATRPILEGFIIVVIGA